jgi:RimJ/RimL family protein N-acetyltransferase
VEPSPPEARELRFVVPLLAHEASYFAASARIASFLLSSMLPGKVRPPAAFGCGGELLYVRMNSLETPRLILRDFAPADLDRLAELCANDGFMQFSAKGPLTRAEAETLFERIHVRTRCGEPTQFAVITRETQELIGYCGFFLQNVDGVDEIEIGYRLDPDWWGGGLATEAARAVRDHAFGTLGLERVISIIHPDNLRSQRVAEKNGLMKEKETCFKTFDVWIYALTRPQWQAARDAG